MPRLPPDFFVQDGSIVSAGAEALSMEDTMGVFAALDVSQEETAVCVVGQDGAILTEAKVATCPDAIADWLAVSPLMSPRTGWNSSSKRLRLIRSG